MAPIKALSIHTETLPGGISFPMIKVEGGRFWMGDDEGEGYFISPKPAHQVELDSFWMGQFLVTQKIWQAIMGENPSHFKGANRPVESISWEDAQKFIKKLNTELGLEGARAYRLPTEAEWEYAARGGEINNGFTYAGSEQMAQIGWYYGNSQSETRPVGILLPNELGLYDMSGNVWEWCVDWFDENYYKDCFQKGITKNPKGPESGRLRVLRGGSWGLVASYCRVADRFVGHPSDRLYGRGLRLSRTAL